MQHRTWIAVAALSGLLAVAAGAFAAHGFDATGDVRGARLVETGARYQMWHALAMLACLALTPALRLPLWLWAAGTALFSFSLYALALGAPQAAALATPVGGTALLLGWAALAWCVLRARA
ncbi:MAG: DUF423 domain-containing protein [Geminicoccaceae bacterium]